MVWCIMNGLDYKAAKDTNLEKRVPFFEYISISDLGPQSVLCMLSFVLDVPRSILLVFFVLQTWAHYRQLCIGTVDQPK